MFEATEYDDYFLWLCGLVDADMTRYSELLYILHDSDFMWCLELDESRETEGLMLREEFYNQDLSQDWIMFLEKPCSVLEVLIPIARRMNDVFESVDSSDMTRVWFWELIKNLGLKKYSNIRLEYEDRENDLIDINLILSRWMNREFEPDGTGSLFPLKTPTKDQRERSIIYQMYDYAFENYISEETN